MGIVESYNPATGEVLGSVEVTPPEQIDAVVAAVGQVQPLWALLRVEDRARYMRRMAQAIIDELDELVVVCGAVELSGVVPEAATLLRNDDWSLGQATSLRVALDWCARQGHLSAVIGLGDLPGLSPDAWRTVAAARGGPMVFATYYGKRGHPVRLDAEIWSLLPISGDEGARSLASRRPELVTEVACEGTTADIDTQEDLRRWS